MQPDETSSYIKNSCGFWYWRQCFHWWWITWWTEDRWYKHTCHHLTLMSGHHWWVRMSRSGPLFECLRFPAASPGAYNHEGNNFLLSIVVQMSFRARPRAHVSYHWYPHGDHNIAISGTTRVGSAPTELLADPARGVTYVLVCVMIVCNAPYCSLWFDAHVCSLTSLVSLRWIYEATAADCSATAFAIGSWRLQVAVTGQSQGSRKQDVNHQLCKCDYIKTSIIAISCIDDESFEWSECVRYERMKRTRKIRANEANKDYSCEWSEWELFARIVRIIWFGCAASNHLTHSAILIDLNASNWELSNWMILMQLNRFILATNRPIDFQPERLELSVAVCL